MVTDTIYMIIRITHQISLHIFVYKPGETIRLICSNYAGPGIIDSSLIHIVSDGLTLHYNSMGCCSIWN